MAPSSQDQQQHDEDTQKVSSSSLMTGLKLAAAAGFLLSALVTLSNNGGQSNHPGFAAAAEVVVDEHPEAQHHRRLQAVDGNTPSYMESLMKDLKERKKLFAETPPEEVKYWFEYTGPLQVRLQVYGCIANVCLRRHTKKNHPKKLQGRDETIKA